MSKDRTSELAARVLRHLSDAGSPRRLLEGTMGANETGGVYEVAADIGNSRSIVLVREPGQERPIEVAMPSARTLNGASSYRLFASRRQAPNSWSKLGAGEHIISRDGLETFVGELALHTNGEASAARGSERRYSDGTTLDLLLCGIAAALPKQDSVTCRVATGVPAELWPLVYQEVGKALVGRHAFTYNGRSVAIDVVEVQVYREGEAAWKCLPEGKREGRTLIIDGGGQTINVLPLHDGQLNGARPRTFALGAETILDDLSDSLIAQGLRKLSEAERRELQVALRDGGQYEIVTNNRRVRVDQVARRFFERAAINLTRELSAGIRLGLADNIWLIGGLAHFVGERMRQADLIPTLQVPAREPEAMNAYGYLAELGGTVARRGRKR